MRPTAVPEIKTVSGAPRGFVKSEAQLEGGLTATSDMDCDSVGGKMQLTFRSGTAVYGDRSTVWDSDQR